MCHRRFKIGAASLEGTFITTRVIEGLYWLIAACVLLCFMLYFLAENGRINAFATYLLAVAVIALALFSEPREQLLGLGGMLLWLVLALIGYLGLSSLWADHDDPGRYLGYGLLIVGFVTGLCLACKHFPRFLGFLLILVLVCASLSAVVSIYLHFALPDYKPLPEPRLYALGRLSNPVISATSYGFALLFTVDLFRQHRHWYERGLVITAAAILITAIALTGSRTVWLALALGIGTLFAIQQRRHALWIMAGAIGIATLAMLLLVGMEALTRRAFSFRPEIWTEFISRTLESNVLIGFGSGQEAKFQLPKLLIQHPHSVFVSTFYFSGLIGLSLLIGMIIACTRLVFTAAPSRIRSLAIMCGLFGLTVGLLDGDNILTKIDYLWWIVWFPVALCLLLSNKPSGTSEST